MPTYNYRYRDRSKELFSDGKTKVEFTDMSADTIKLMQGLSKSALKESGKIVRKILRNNIPKRYGNLKNHIASWAFVNKQTGQPCLQVGFYTHSRVRKRGKIPSHANPHWIEFGTRPHVIKAKNVKSMGYGDDFYGGAANHPGQKDMHVLRNDVYDNIAEIKSAQEAFLKELSDTIEAASGKVSESEDVEDE